MKKWLLITIIIIILLTGGTLFYLYEYTNVFHSKLIPKINTITLNYAPGYDYEKALEKNKENEFIKIQTIKLNEEEIKTIKKDIKNIIESTPKKKDFETYKELVINKDTQLIIGEKYAKIIKNNKTTYVKIPNALVKDTDTIVDKNNEKVLETIKYEKATIKKDGAVINITNEDNIKLIKDAIPYYRINQTDDYLTYDNGYKELLILNDNINIYLYSSNIGYIKSTESYYVILPNNLENVINSIYEVSTK